MGLGVIDHLGQKLLSERRQRAFPQFPGGLTLLDEAPLLSSDRACIHPIREMVDGATGDRVFLDGLRALVRRYARAQNLVRLTVIGQVADSAAIEEQSSARLSVSV